MKAFELKKNKSLRMNIDGSINIFNLNGKIIIDTSGCVNIKDGPVYKHECDSCIFLYSEYDHKKRKWNDIYFCPQEPTIVIRYSEAGHDYKSGIGFENVDPQIKRAYDYCVELGFLEKEIKNNDKI